jgi:hypothetical protein
MNNTTFNPREHLITLKNRQSSSEYLPVQWRLVWFRQECPNGSIETELVHLDLERETEEETFVWNAEKRRSEKVTKTGKGLAIFKATVRDGKGGIATGTKMEKSASFGDWLEKAETGAIGRALAALGYGTQFAPELDEAHRIVDSPVDFSNNSNTGTSHAENGSAAMASAVRPNIVSRNGSAASSTVTDNNTEAGVTEQQLSSIRKLCERLGKAEPENVTAISSLSARKLIQQLTAEYNAQKHSSKAS